MVAESELGVKLVPDESALENIEEKQLEIAGEPDSVAEAQEQNEQQTEQLNVVSRRLGRISTKLGQFALIAAVLGVIAKLLGGFLDIGFEDVRNSVVSAINQLLEPLQNAVPDTGTVEGATQGGLNLISAGTPGFFSSGLVIQALDELNQGGDGGGGTGTGTANFNLFTSRDQLSGDSTQKEQQAQNFDFFSFEGGS